MFDFHNASASAFAPHRMTFQPWAQSNQASWAGGLLGQSPGANAAPPPWYGQFNWMTGSPWNGPHQQQPTMDQRINHGGGASGNAAQPAASPVAPSGPDLIRDGWGNPYQAGDRAYDDWLKYNPNLKTARGMEWDGMRWTDIRA